MAHTAVLDLGAYSNKFGLMISSAPR